MKILPSITTYLTPDWAQRIKQLDRLKIKEIALFLTSVNLAERKKLYQLLKNTKVKRIPHVHLREEMESWELKWLAKNYQTKLFNIHANPKFEKIIRENPRFLPLIYVENGSIIDDYFIKILKQCAGLCLDFAHWVVGDNFKRPGYEQLPALVKEYKIGCAHVSAFVAEGRKEYDQNQDLWVSYAPHSFEKLQDLNYLKKFKKILPKFVSLELVNSLEEQLQAKKYLEKLLA
jgi:hypothetical protein